MKKIFILDSFLNQIETDPRIGILEDIYVKISGDEEFLCYINSIGGHLDTAQFMSYLIEDMKSKTTVFGAKVSSASVLIFSSFQNRIALSDATFLIHRSRSYDKEEKKWKTSEDENQDFEVWKYISSRIKKISPEDLYDLAKKEKKLTPEEALEIGLVQGISKLSSKEFERMLV